MISQFLDCYRVTIWTLVALAALLALHQWSGVSRWLLMIPMLLSTFALMALWERLFLRK